MLVDAEGTIHYNPGFFKRVGLAAQNLGLTARDKGGELGFAGRRHNASLKWGAGNRAMIAKINEGFYKDFENQAEDIRKLASEAIKLARNQGLSKIVFQGITFGPAHFEGLGLKTVRKRVITQEGSSFFFRSLRDPSRTVFNYEEKPVESIVYDYELKL